MIKARASEAERRGWQVTSPSAFQDTLPVDMAPLSASASASASASVSASGLPPLTAVLHGLHSRELDTDSVFDKFFGPQSSGL